MGPEKDLYKHSQLFFDKGANQFNGERAVFSRNGPRTAETHTEVDLHTNLTVITLKFRKKTGENFSLAMIFTYSINDVIHERKN